MRDRIHTIICSRSWRVHFNDNRIIRAAKSFAAGKHYGFALTFAHYARDCEECETKEGMVDRIDVEVELTDL